MRKKRFPTRGAEKHLRKKAEGLPKKSGASRVLKEESWCISMVGELLVGIGYLG